MGEYLYSLVNPVFALVTLDAIYKTLTVDGITPVDVVLRTLAVLVFYTIVKMGLYIYNESGYLLGNPAQEGELEKVGQLPLVRKLMFKNTNKQLTK